MITINGQCKRNLPEQVDYLSGKVKDLKEETTELDERVTAVEAATGLAEVITDAVQEGNDLKLTKYDAGEVSTITYTPQTGEPEQYIKAIDINNNQLTWYNKDDDPTTWEPDFSDQFAAKLDKTAERIKTAVTSGSTLTLTKQDGSTVVYSPTITGAMTYKGIVASTDLPATGNNGDYYMLNDGAHVGQCAVYNSGTSSYDFGVATVTVDATTSTSSVNPVQNQAITNYVNTNLDTKLSLRGGTMTGAITSSQNIILKRNNDTNETIILGATAWNKGSALALRGGEGDGNDVGTFILRASDNTGAGYQLFGTCDGSLAWSNSILATSNTGPAQMYNPGSWNDATRATVFSKCPNLGTLFIPRLKFTEAERPSGITAANQTGCMITKYGTNYGQITVWTSGSVANNRIYRCQVNGLNGTELSISDWSEFVPTSIQTTAPSAAITDGGIHFVKLAAGSTGVTEYDGYIYLYEED